jgi:hypothetical protein
LSAAALEAWMSIENLEERLAAPGWIDPVVADYLRAAALKAAGPQSGDVRPPT